MESFRIVIKKSAAKEIERIEKKDRIRQGNYRILYQVIDDELIINVVKVGHRRDIYSN